MVMLAVFVATLMFAYAGFLYVTASANKANIETAKKVFSSVFLGLIFILTAWLIIDLSLRVLTGTKDLNVLTQIQCVDFVGASATNPTGYQQSPGVTPSVNNPVGNAAACTNCVTPTAFACKNQDSCLVTPAQNLRLNQMAADLKAQDPNVDLSEYYITETGVNTTVTHASGSSNLDMGCKVKGAGGACTTTWVKNVQRSWPATAVYETNSQADYDAKIAAGVPRNKILLLTGTFVNGVCSAGAGKCITAPHISLKGT
jgi:hypothetical protein